jgi:hypothetical protein
VDLLTAQSTRIVEAEWVHGANIPVAEVIDDDPMAHSAPTPPQPGFQSWPFRWGRSIGQGIQWLYGCVSIVVVMAILANIPILQFLSFGYLLETSGQVARSGKWWSGVQLPAAASRIGSFLLGSWLCLWPARLVSDLWYSAYLINPQSVQTQTLFVVEWLLVIGTFCHILAAGLCGGRLRHFLWPLVAPISLGIWLLQRLLRTRLLNRILQATLGRFAPKFLSDLTRISPLTEWFLPAIVWQQLRSGRVWSEPQQRFWTFVGALRLRHYLVVGAKGFLGSLAWLIIPTALLIRATLTDDAIAVVSSIFGSILATFVFSMLPILQTHFAVEQRFAAFWDVGHVWRQWRRAPIWHLLSIVVMLILALPLFLLKIEEIPRELLWMLSLVFITFTWPSRFLLGWAYYCGRRREKPRAWWWAWPTAGLVFPLAFVFVLIMSLTRYTSWHGSWSLLENHVFLLPAPFWLSFL